MRIPSLTQAYQFFMVFRFGIMFGISWLLARILPDKSDIADYEKLLFISASLSFFWISGLFSSFLTLFKSTSKKEQADLLSETLSLHFVLSLFSVAFLLIICLLFFPNIPQNLVFAFCLFFLFNTLSHPAEYVWVAKEKPIVLILWAIIPFSIHFLCFALPLLFGYSLTHAFYLAACFSGVKFFCQFFFIEREAIYWFPNLDLRRKLISFGLPLAFSAIIAGTSAAYIDSYLVSHFFTDGEFVNFQYGAKEFPLVLILANALSAIISANLAGDRKNQGEFLLQLKRGTARLLHIFGPLSFLLLLFSDVLYIKIFGPDFSSASQIFDIYLLLLIPRLLFPQAILKGFLKTHVFYWISTGELLANLSLSLIFMSIWGIQGIALGTLIASVLEKGILILVCKKQTGVDFREYHPILIWTFYSLVLLLAWTAKVFWWPFNF